MNKELDIVIRGGIKTGLDLNEYYEVRLGPVDFDGVVMWRVSRPVERQRAIELAEYLLRNMEESTAFVMPEEFNIIGRLEPVSK